MNNIYLAIVFCIILLAALTNAGRLSEQSKIIHREIIKNTKLYFDLLEKYFPTDSDTTPLLTKGQMKKLLKDRFSKQNEILNREIEKKTKLYLDLLEKYIPTDSDTTSLLTKRQMRKLLKIVHPTPISLIVLWFVFPTSSILLFTLPFLTFFDIDTKAFPVVLIPLGYLIYTCLLALYIYYLKKHQDLLMLKYSFKNPALLMLDDTGALTLQQIADLRTSQHVKITLVRFGFCETLNIIGLCLVLWFVISL